MVDPDGEWRGRRPRFMFVGDGAAKVNLIKKHGGMGTKKFTFFRYRSKRSSAIVIEFV